MKISICVPTWEQYGLGPSFLRDNLESIKKQSYKNFNVIISDHSKNDEIKNVCDSFKNYFELKYFRYQEKFGSGPANTNNAILNADGDLIKILFQDDFLYSSDSLQNIVESFESSECKWLVNGCNHTVDDGKTFINEMIPRWNEGIPIGVNTISSPSVLSFINNEPCLFDENLIMLMDCEMYYQLFKRYGTPYIIGNTLTTNRIHDHQISRLYNQDMNDEINYVKQKHKII